jgi:hypothetical protein
MFSGNVDDWDLTPSTNKAHRSQMLVQKKARRALSH